MLARVFTLCVLLAPALATSAGTACGSLTTCKDCVGAAFCGWCSPGRIQFHNGTVGGRCGDQRNKEAWTCQGSYQTDECIMGYACQPPPKSNYTCKKAGLGEGSPNKTCTSGCGKAATIYACDNKTYTCKPVPAGTAGAAGQSVCNKTCAPYAKCNSATWKCDKASPDTPGALPASACATSCHDASKFMCKKDATTGNYSCAATSEPFMPTKAECLASCHTPEPKPFTPQSLLGFWRGIQINAGFLKGEWSFNFEKTSVTASAPSKDAAFHATVSMLADPATGREEVWLVLQDGKYSGKTVKALYQIGPNGPETQHLLMAFGEPDVPAKAEAPTSFDTVMGGGFGEFLLSQCSNSGPSCSFTVPPAARRQLKAPAVTDPCNLYTTCSTCIAHKNTCGWCSVNVVYNDTSSPGFQCAGFNKEGKPTPSWHCPAHYSRTDCTDFVCDVKTETCREAQPGDSPPFVTKDFCETELCKKAPPSNTSSYACSHPDFTCAVVPKGTPGASPSFGECNKTCIKPKPVPGYQCSSASNWTCEHVDDGGVPSKAICDASCIKPKPHNNTPSGLVGDWRGIAIENGYAVGEWTAKITKSDITFHTAKDASWTAVTGAGGGADLIFTVTSGKDTGKTIACLFTSASGPETVRMTVAFGVPGPKAGAKPPLSYDDAVKAGNTVLVLAKCGADKYCKF